ncbi:phosphoketolase family protein [Rubinisphaera margarita]|uniref:phosphoketolase family protein n=1 Tax=Rubinisphaera margarita TaxID=2909586 RepID=UPI001EE810E7|nr:phosphoketolase family protein [Rubinisphaera margarita]MCG6155681.1 phosphoketolase family protein [Rubinisphaera margarita]
MSTAVLTDRELDLIDRYWRASNYLSAGQIYLLDNPLLRQPLEQKHIKPRLLGHWGTCPGLNLIYVHLNRVIKQDRLNVIYITGPGHGGPALVAQTYLEGTYSEFYPEITQDEPGLQKLFKQFSFPGGISSHVSPEVPGSINEGGELGYSLSHAFGAAFDNPDLIVACVVGDGEAETGALATGWHGNKFLNPKRDGAVLPILHLNGYKIASPTVLARLPQSELASLMTGYGYEPHFVEGDDPPNVHQQFAATLDECLRKIHDIQQRARNGEEISRPTWPMIVLRTPKGWTCPEEVDGKKTEGFWRSHQLPIKHMDESDHLSVLEHWLRSYDPDSLFDAEGKLMDELAALAPEGTLRMGASAHANGGLLLKKLTLPDFRKYAVDVPAPGAVTAEATRVQGSLLRDVMKENETAKNFRLFSPDENNSNRWDNVLDVTDRCFMGDIRPEDTSLSPEGRVLEMLSEHQCQGWLEGYLLTGRHGFFSCYEAFIHIVDSMFNQHAKWLKVSREVPWREPIASLNYLLSSHVWRQDHNGFSHQDPGFLNHVANKKAEIIRIYLPPDANCLLSVTDHCLNSRDYVNVIVCGKQPSPQWLNMKAAAEHCANGIGIWDWASSDDGDPDLIMACCGDVPTMETLAAVDLLRQHVPELKIRVINVVDLMKLHPESRHPHGLTDVEFDRLFLNDRPIIFAFHGYPTLIHELIYKRSSHHHFHVHGYNEEGTTTTPFDMVVRNQLDRYHLAMNGLKRLPSQSEAAKQAINLCEETLKRHHHYTREHGEDLPEVRDWKWSSSS